MNIPHLFKTLFMISSLSLALSLVACQKKSNNSDNNFPTNDRNQSKDNGDGLVNGETNWQEKLDAQKRDFEEKLAAMATERTQDKRFYEANLRELRKDLAHGIAKIKTPNTKAFFEAIKNEDIDAVKDQIKKGVDVNVRDNSGRTALLQAVWWNESSQILETLIKAGADVDVSSKGTSALYGAVFREKNRFVLTLLMAGADPNRVNKANWAMSPLVMAVIRDNGGIVQSLLTFGADHNIAIKKYFSDNPIHLWNFAAEKGSYRALRRFILNDESNFPDSNIFRVFAGRFFDPNDPLIGPVKDMAEAVEKETDFMYGVNSYYASVTLLMIASMNLRVEDYRELLSLNPDLNLKSSYGGHTALMIASKYGRADIVKLLIEKGADLEIVDNKKTTALMHASGSGHLEVVKLLIEAGAKIGTADKQGGTFSYVLNSNNIELVKLLVKSGANLTYARKEAPSLVYMFSPGVRPEKETSQWVNLAIWLVENGNLDLEARYVFNGFSTTAVHSAAKNIPEDPKRAEAQTDRTPLLEALIKAGVNINTQDSVLKTPLMVAVADNNLKAVQLLLKAGADLSYRDKKGRSALDYAKDQNSQEIIEAIQKKLDENN